MLEKLKALKDELEASGDKIDLEAVEAAAILSLAKRRQLQEQQKLQQQQDAAMAGPSTSQGQIQGHGRSKPILNAHAWRQPKIKTEDDHDSNTSTASGNFLINGLNWGLN